MPNWVSNTFIIKGNKKEVNYFLSKGNIETITDFNDGTELTKKLENVSLRSWLPLPQIFEDYNTTNQILSKDHWDDKMYHELTGDVSYKTDNSYEDYVRGYKEAAADQYGIYRIVGWYNYNMATLGVKWDARMEVNTENSFEDNDNVTLYFEFESAWDMPLVWFDFMCRKFYYLKFFIYGMEESGIFVKAYSNVIKDEYSSYSLIDEMDCEALSEEFEISYQSAMTKIDTFKEKFMDYVTKN